jgi:hypothetical protein
MIGAGIGSVFLAAALTGAGPEDQGLYFGSPGGSVTLADVPVADGGTPLTVEFRFKTVGKLKDSYKAVARWDPQAKDADRGTFFVEVGSSGRINFGLLNAQGTPKTVSARSAWRDGLWHHVAAVWDGVEAILYVDGKRAAGEKLDGFGKLAPSKLPLTIGPAADPKGRAKDFFEGFISDVAVWNASRDADTLAATLKAPLSGKEPGLAAFLPLREKVPVDKTGGATLSPALARVGWCRTPWWFEEKPDRPYLHFFSYDPGIGEATREFLVHNESKGEVGILWQDRASKVQLTWVDAGLGEPRTVPLKGLSGALLAAGATDAKGNVYYLMIESSSPGRAETIALKASMYLAGPDGKALREAPFDTSKDQFNVHEFGQWKASMAIGKDSGCLILPRIMYRSPDGLNHQGAIAVTFGLDLSKLQNHGQTSGHSFGNLLTEDSRGEFIGLDLGDNYPRGVHLHRIDRGGRTSRVVYTYKTAHATTARNGSPVYSEISGKGNTFYKWSRGRGPRQLLDLLFDRPLAGGQGPRQQPRRHSRRASGSGDASGHQELREGAGRDAGERRDHGRPPPGREAGDRWFLRFRRQVGGSAGHRGPLAHALPPRRSGTRATAVPPTRRVDHAPLGEDWGRRPLALDPDGRRERQEADRGDPPRCGAPPRPRGGPAPDG